MPPGQAESLNRRVGASSMKQLEDGRVCIRIVSEGRPAGDAVPVSPNLEDVYLYQTMEGGRGV